MVATAPPFSVDVGLITEHSGRFLLMNVQGSGKIRFYGIAYGAGAGLDSLKTMADACDGMVVSGDTQGIKAIYERLSTYV